MMMTPQPLHSFMNTLFSAPTSFEEDLAKYEFEDQELEVIQSVLVTTIVYKLNDGRHINIVQDNAYAHSNLKTSIPQYHPSCRELDLSGSEKRWSHDASLEREETNQVKQQPRCPRRRLSMDYCSTPDNETTETIDTASEVNSNNNSNNSNSNRTPRCPRRRVTMEFVSTTAAPTPTPTPAAATDRPRMPQRQGTAEDIILPQHATATANRRGRVKSRRQSLDETMDENASRPRFPQRRGSLTHAPQEDAPTTSQNEEQQEQAQQQPRSDRIAHRPQRRSSLVCSSEMPSAVSSREEDSHPHSGVLLSRRHSTPDVYQMPTPEVLEEL